MRLLFVTGADREFFPTLLGTLQSFADRLPGERLLVCDYGLGPAQQAFLRRHDLLLERPAWLSPGLHPYHLKTALAPYLRQRFPDLDAWDAVVWLDADLLLLDVSAGDFASMVAALRAANSPIAASPTGSIGAFLGFLRESKLTTAPFERVLSDTAVDPALPYYSTGVFICRSPAFLDRWSNLSLATAHHHCIDQNLFNIVIHRAVRPPLALELDLWQAQGRTLDALRIEGAAGATRALLGERSVKIIHVTSPHAEHIYVGPAALAVEDVVVAATFKVFRPNALAAIQLELIARFVLTHRAELRALGIAAPAPTPVTGYDFRSLS